MTGCVFCHIVSGDAPASVIHRGDGLTAFLDHRPVTPGHLLVVPNRHVVTLDELSEELACHMFALARRLASALRTSDLGCQAVNLFLADGPTGGQEVLHTHLHVIPRRRGDGFEITADAWSRPAPDRHVLDGIAGRVRQALEGDAS